ncbi:hypothetical protein B0H13DRAFT_1892023 [Mycena leptocephala]|nr:hypothetical protein B0H13DRAFT_1892023 [Mycena leptocephala]
MVSDAIKRAGHECTGFCPVIDLKHGVASVEIAETASASQEAPNWMDSLGLVSTPELEAVLNDPLISLTDHPALLNLTEQECQTRVLGVGSVLLQLLSVQHKLGEPFTLNGDLIEDLKDESVVACLPDGEEALNAMFSAIPSTSTRSGVLVQQMLAFKSDHTIFEEELGPPIFRRDRPSHFPPTDPIPVVVNGALERKESEEIGAERPVKRVKLDPKEERKGGGSPLRNARETTTLTTKNRQNAPELTREKPRKVRARARTNSPPRGRPLGALVRETGSVDNRAVGSKKRYPIRLGAFVQSVDSDCGVE